MTQAAPKLKLGGDERIRISDEEQYAIFFKRACSLLRAAAKEGATGLILGAFGCGALACDLHVVAKAYKDALGKYANYFEEIEFAVLDKSGGNNSEIFRDILLS